MRTPPVVRKEPTYEMPCDSRIQFEGFRLWVNDNLPMGGELIFHNPNGHKWSSDFELANAENPLLEVRFGLYLVTGEVPQGDLEVKPPVPTLPFLSPGSSREKIGHVYFEKGRFGERESHFGRGYEIARIHFDEPVFLSIIAGGSEEDRVITPRLISLSYNSDSGRMHREDYAYTRGLIRRPNRSKTLPQHPIPTSCFEPRASASVNAVA